MAWIKRLCVRRDAPASWRRLGRIFSAGAAMIANLPVPVFAAELAAGAPATSVSLPAFTWTGLYLGANACAWFAPANPGYEAIGFHSTDFDLPASGGAKAGFTGGFQAGYNYQIGSLVPGFETDFNYLGNCCKGTFAAPPARPSHPHWSDAQRRAASPGSCHRPARAPAANDHPAPWQWPECAASARGIARGHPEQWVAGDRRDPAFRCSTQRPLTAIPHQSYYLEIAGLEAGGTPARSRHCNRSAPFLVLRRKSDPLAITPFRSEGRIIPGEST
jgi:hypothetical protein